MKSIFYLFTWLLMSIVLAEPIPNIIGPMTYMDNKTIVVADQSFVLPARYEIQTDQGQKISIGSIKHNQTVAIYATWPTPLSQPVVNKIVLQR